MRYLLDTKTCVDALRNRGRVVDRLRDHRPDDIGVTMMTVAELWSGARHSARPDATRREVDAFLAPLEVLPFDAAAAEQYARLRFELERSGQRIGERDLLVAAIAAARGLTVVTHDIAAFARAGGVLAEDWL